MKRREFIATVGGAAAMWPLSARAQQPRKIPKIGVLWHAGSAEEEGPYLAALREGFRDIGYVDGKTFILENRFPNEQPERRWVSSSRDLHRPDSSWGKASRSSGTVVGQVRVDRESEDREGYGLEDPRVIPCARRQSDRIDQPRHLH